jgi:hypothetical protein
MTDNDLMTELMNFNGRVRNMSGLVRRNISDGILLVKMKIKVKIVNSELTRRKLQYAKRGLPKRSFFLRCPLDFF